MLDQSFSNSNFNLIFLKENRKGIIKKRHLNQAYFDKHDEFKVVLDEKITLKNSKADNKLSQEELEGFAKRFDDINKAKEEIRNNLFSEYSDIVNDEESPFVFDIKYDKQNKIYTTNKDGVSFFSIKQLQRNLNKTFNVIQADRNKIIKQVYNLISDGFPKVIIRTDVKKFYESIPQGKLFEKIENNTLLSPLSKKLLKRLFFEFERIKDVTEMAPKKGIPRGLGVSAYLSELYMRDIDSQIKSLPDIIYYARYVDDIIVIFSPKTKSQRRDYQSEIKEIINNHQLEIKDGSDGTPSKTFPYELLEKPLSKQQKLTFLGYKFIINQNYDTKIELSDDKLKRYVSRIELSIETYNNDCKYDEKKARKMLIDRLKFLIGNYHLNHNKKNIKAGIFYTNQMLKLNNSEFNSLNTLNARMYNKFNRISPPINIGIDKARLIDFFKSKFCFKEGFNNKENHFFSFKFNQKEQSYYNIKYKRATNKFEVIKSIWKNE
ncbi:antiviral reverse transcriptase Drt3a [Flavobacterium humi]|uniref:RNA-directed DNA polymerase n=1 Tax=Flavobacterium humi TaxID=2562683 RepID=A0A4Z0L5I8_9FLAO|nr:antiviral reverse transcriptase Drt3a [Flavobacterium humi]TGD57518.1 RNA-directed DNA polymerase [Flavobacterium humi]